MQDVILLLLSRLSATTVGRMVTGWQIVQRFLSTIVLTLIGATYHPILTFSPIRKRREHGFLLQRATYAMKKGTSAQTVRAIQKAYILGKHTQY